MSEGLKPFHRTPAEKAASRQNDINSTQLVAYKFHQRREIKALLDPDGYDAQLLQGKSADVLARRDWELAEGIVHSEFRRAIVTRLDDDFDELNAKLKLR